MNERRKSDGPEVPLKSPNNAGQPVAEEMEGRRPAKGNPPQQNAPRTQSREGAPSALERVRLAAARDRRMRFTALLHHIYNLHTLRTAYLTLKREAAAGVDGETWRHYGERLEENLHDLSERLKRGAYRAKPVRRVYIAKADGRQRPLGVTALEDKIVQRATVEVLNAIYETDFLGFSYGFRPGRSQHHALDALYAGLLTKKVNWVLDLDIRGFLETHSQCTPSVGCRSKRPGRASGTWILKPFRRPSRTWTALSSPRFTRCNTVWRETPSRRVASIMGR
jgi:RNA-directed DNA polymerase